MDLAEDLRASLQELLIHGQVEIRESITPGAPLSWEVRGSSEKPLICPCRLRIAGRAFAGISSRAILPVMVIFRGSNSSPLSPLVYLIAPALRFHPTTDALQRYLSPEMETIRVGLAESWCRGLRVMFRQ
jgi:hypothetical protein